MSHPACPDGARLIKLTRGHWAIVDEADYARLSAYNWTTARRCGGRLYARARVGGDAWECMHRLIVSCRDGLDVDHRNGDSLDNRRDNLREATRSQNLSNRGPQRNNTSGFKGVVCCRRSGKWRAQIVVSGRHRHLGTFETKTSAAIAYNIAAIQLHGEFARVNDVFSGEVPL